jgi:probable F420-dependent oxidoreductase
VKVRIGYGLGTAGLRATPGQTVATTFAGFVDGLEKHGFDSLWLSERITGPAPDPVVGLAVAAGRTSRLKFGMSVMVLPGRNPALLAKELASLDVLSGGRLLPAFGLGVANPAEQQAFGVRREERAPWFDEALPLIRRLWTEDRVDHEGPRFRYRDLEVLPKPLQSPPDVWLGGVAPSELRRVGRLGDGWLPSFITPDEAIERRRSVEEAADQAGRAIDPEHFGALVFYVRHGIPDRLLQLISARRPGLDPHQLVPVGWAQVRTSIERFIAAGFSKFVLLPAEEPPSWADELAEAAAEVLPLQGSR